MIVLRFIYKFIIMPLTFVMSQKNNKLLTHNGYMYSFFSYNKSKTEIKWRCVEYSNTKCPSYCITSSMEEDGYVLKTIIHNHGPDPSKIQAKEAINTVKILASTTNEESTSLINDVVSNLSHSALNTLNISSLNRTVERIRCPKKNHPPNPTKIGDLSISDVYKNTNKNELFLFFDSRQSGLKCKEKFVIFTTQKNLDFLSNCDTWYIDNIFYEGSNIFNTICIFCAYKKGQLIPLIYVMITKKSKSVYSHIFYQLCAVNSEPKPSKIIINFEINMVMAMKKFFPKTCIKGSIFHFSQSIWNKIQNMDLEQLYITDDNYAQHLKMLYALTYIPVHNVTAAYESLIQMPFFVDHQEKLSELLNYMDHTFIGKLTRRDKRQQSIYDIKLWNHHYQIRIDEEYALNYCTEKWHKEFSVSIRDACASIWKLIDFFRHKQELAESDMEQVDKDIEPQPQRSIKRNNKNHKDLLNVIKTWGTIENLEYLRAVALNINY